MVREVVMVLVGGGVLRDWWCVVSCDDGELLLVVRCWWRADAAVCW
jgi:hypothetical protein